MIFTLQHSGMRSSGLSESDPEALRNSRRSLVAKPYFNRWLVPPAALAIHLCIGMAYGFSVFWVPMTELISGNQSGCSTLTLWRALFTTRCNWRESHVTLIYTLFFIFLGCASATCRGWLERNGPRRAGIVAAFCWAGGLAIAAVGIKFHQLWIICVGAGMIGGIGLGLGYISPISTLLAWFPDKRGIAAGMAIMGFGGGALIGSPLAFYLMSEVFSSKLTLGVWQTFFSLAVIYFIFMIGGAFGFRLPPPGWRPPGWKPKVNTEGTMLAKRPVHLKNAHKTPQFWLIWLVLAMNVSAGIGMLSNASTIIQETFGGLLINIKNLSFLNLDSNQKLLTAEVGAGFVGLLSLFNILGRFFWSSISDRIGRKTIFNIYFGLGMVLYAMLPGFIHSHNLGLFVLAFCIIISMVGAGFATIPAYIADLFGTIYAGAILGRLLTAWSVAGIIGPLIVSYLHNLQKSLGHSPEYYYDITVYVLAVLLAIGLIANLMVKQVNSKWHMTDAELAATNVTFERGNNANKSNNNFNIGKGTLNSPMVWIAWSPVVLPMLWGLWHALSKAMIFIP